MITTTGWDAAAWGDGSVLFTARADSGAERQHLARRLSAMLRAEGPTAVLDWIHGFESVLVVVDATMTDPMELASGLLQRFGAADRASTASPTRTFDLPVVFNSEAGPDLAAAAAELGCTQDELVASLTVADLEIGCVGVNMIPLLTLETSRGPVQRLPSPRTRVPAGSVAMAGDRVVVCTVEGPSGWRVVGRTPASLFDIEADPMCSYLAGDALRLRAIGQEDWSKLAGKPIREVGEVAR